MIKETIEVKYIISKEDRTAALSPEDIWPTNSWEHEYWNQTKIFHQFKNNGQVSKSDCSGYDVVNREAERLLKERLELKASTAEDQAKANELAKIVTKAFEGKEAYDIEWDYIEQDEFDDAKTPGWVTIKSKTSHSNWYQGNGFANRPSEYHYQVPVEVEKEALELQGLRKKHQNDMTFDFYACDYPRRTVRVADHDNF